MHSVQENYDVAAFNDSSMSNIFHSKLLGSLGRDDVSVMSQFVC